MLQRTILHKQAALILLLCSLAAPAWAQREHKKPKAVPDNADSLPTLIWRDPGDVSKLDLFYGSGGKKDAPASKFTFIKEDMAGTSPKFDVEDEQGVRWRVKLGEEPKSETAATRLLWAAGYFTDEDYYVEELHVEGLPKLHRGQNWVSADGTVHQARLKRHIKHLKKLGNWSWYDNPFVGTREFNGLRVMMALLNNWDLKETNNTVYEVDGERRYVVSDVGATFGNTGEPLTRSKSKLKDYSRTKFIEKTTPDDVDFVMHSRPLFLTVFNYGNYKKRSKMEEVAKHIPRADAKWLGQRLAQLSESQIRDCFRAAGYSPEEIEGYTKVVQNRIAELNAL